MQSEQLVRAQWPDRDKTGIFSDAILITDVGEQLDLDSYERK